MQLLTILCTYIATLLRKDILASIFLDWQRLPGKAVTHYFLCFTCRIMLESVEDDFVPTRFPTFCCGIIPFHLIQIYQDVI
jgi:hypothetical protein